MGATPRFGWLLTRATTTPPRDPLRPRYVALKIITASRGQQEATLLYELQALLRSRPVRSSSPAAIKTDPVTLLHCWITFRLAGRMAHTAASSPNFLVRVSPISIDTRGLKDVICCHYPLRGSVGGSPLVRAGIPPSSRLTSA